MERSDWSDDEPFAFRPPLPPEDRVWRHPSELGAGVGSGFVAPTRRASVSRGKLAVAVVASATGALLVAALVSVAVGTGGSGRAAVMESSATSFGFTTTLPGVTGLARPPDGVVHLVAATDDGDRYSSGVVLDDRGTIVTTVGAVNGAHRITALLADGSQQDAVLLGVDQDAGAAVLRVPGRPLSASSGWAIVMAPGAVLHTSGGGATATVAALGANAVDDKGNKLSHLVKLTVDSSAKAAWAAEGTPLLDDHERVVGLCTYDRDGHVYAVPIEIPRAAARSIDVHGRVVVPWLGLTGHDEPGTDGGAVVQAVADDSPAEAAGLQPGDVVLALDGEPVTSMATLALGLRAYDAGAMVDLTYVRDSTVLHAFPTLAEHA